MTDLTERLRNWHRVYLEDDGRPEGALYHDADCAGNLADHARAALQEDTG